MTAIEKAQHYFDLSNASDFDRIKSLFTKSSTYCSGTGELYLGVNDIMAMQRSYHGSFKSLKWQVNTVDQIKSDIILLDFDFKGESQACEKVEYSGLEYIIIHNEKIQHIDVRRK
jgi:hypothetical protein